jgi:hypothetical protein
MAKTSSKLKNKEDQAKKVEFAFSQGEKELITTIDVSNALENKASKYITIFIAVLVVSIGSFFTAFFDCNSPLHRLSIIVGLILFNLFFLRLLYKAVKALSVTNYHFLGRSPKDIFDSGINEYYQLIKAEANLYNSYIKQNRKNNRQKAIILKQVEKQLLIYISTSLVIFFVIESLSCFFCFFC